LYDLKQKVISSILNNQLTAMLDNLSTESNRQYESKVVAFQRVRWVSTTVLRGVEAVLHGSNALGISLPSSDVDIMLVESGCRSRDEVISCLRQLEAYFRSF
jgi:predicted nucleotidyltransferase